MSPTVTTEGGGYKCSVVAPKLPAFSLQWTFLRSSEGITIGLGLHLDLKLGVRSQMPFYPIKHCNPHCRHHPELRRVGARTRFEPPC